MLFRLFRHNLLQIICSPSFKPEGVVVEEVEVDEKVEAGLRRERVVEEGGDGAPQLEPVEEVLPGEDQPLRVQQAEAAEQREQDRQAEPVPREDRQGLEPVLKFCQSNGNKSLMAGLYPKKYNTNLDIPTGRHLAAICRSSGPKSSPPKHNQARDYFLPFRDL